MKKGDISDGPLDLAAFRRETTPGEPAVARLHHRIMAEADDEPLTDWLSALPRPGGRARSRVVQQLSAPTSRSLWRPSLALAAGLSLAVGVWQITRTAPPPSTPAQVVATTPPTTTPSATTPPAPLVRTPIDAPDQWQTVQVEPLVQLEALGAGQVEHQGSRTDIQWSLGELRVEVSPDRGRQVSVRTAEATVRVVGTSFTVERDVWGTQVSVSRGLVEVTCADAAPVQLTSAARHHCLPATALDLLTLANRLERDGTDPEEILAVLERGLSMAPGAQEQELLLHKQVRALDRAGRGAQALLAAETFLAAGHDFRRDDVLRIAILRALEEGGCARAAPHLATLEPAHLGQLAPGCGP